jgi:methyl-accepting chemotaxis protein
MNLPGPRAVVSWAVETVTTTVTTVVSIPGRVLGLLTSAEQAVARANELIARTDVVLTSAEDAVEHARQVTQAADEIVQATKPMLRFVAELSAHEVEAAIKLVDELPKLAEHMTRDIMPILATMERVGPDIHELLDVVKDLRQAIQGIPGFGYLRRRGEERELED